MTEWREHPNYPGYYLSDDGQFKGPTGLLKATFDKTNGYYKISVQISPGKQKRLTLHRAVCETFHGPPPAPKAMALHKDHNRKIVTKIICTGETMRRI